MSRSDSRQFQNCKVCGLPAKDLRSNDRLTVDPRAHLQFDLALKAIAWVYADREADDLSATLTSLDPVSKELEYTKTAFHRANQLADECDEEFRQAARSLVEVLEGSRPQI